MNLKYKLSTSSIRWMLWRANNQNGFVAAALGAAASSLMGGGIAGSIAGSLVSGVAGELMGDIMGGGGGSSSSGGGQVSAGSSKGLMSASNQSSTNAQRLTSLKQAQQPKASDTAQPVGLQDTLKSTAFNMDTFRSNWADRLDKFASYDEDEV